MSGSQCPHHVTVFSVIPLPELPPEEAVLEQEWDSPGPMRANLKPKTKVSERWMDLGFALVSLPR